MALPPLVSPSAARFTHFTQFTHFTHSSPREPSSQPAESSAETPAILLTLMLQRDP